MSADDRVGPEESVLASYDGEQRWVLTDRRLLRGDAELPLSAVRSVERVDAGRDLRYLYFGLTSLTLAVLVPTVAAGAGVGFFEVAPLAAVLALGCPVGLVAWFRSARSRYRLHIEGTSPSDEAGRAWQLPADGETDEFVERLRSRL